MHRPDVGRRSGAHVDRDHGRLECRATEGGVEVGVVLITGCSSGIGLETALAFARRGDTVYASMRNPSKADRLQERAKVEGLDVEVVTLDVNDAKSVTKAVSTIEKQHGAIDVLVNNAGVGFSGPVETVDIAKAKAVID